MKSVWLVGMPGCGKSTAGRIYAKMAGREFVDLDALIEKRERMTIPELFSQRGEAGFRDAETAALLSVCSRENMAAATGGGVVLRGENVSAMKKSGTVVFLDRPVEEIEKSVDRESRPLLCGGKEALYGLYRARIGLYRAACDAVLPVSGTPEETARALLKLMGGR